ncbi:hypothetical protein IGI39_003641 [Enterococcus sp. AZ135]|uniref:helix-turn-helix transcriptional regulator n=1 Tax=unclassified Enterococcus TaxID=2608891 RepID=UPI003F218E63
MKKSERIQQELFFVNNHKEFNLTDIMNEFQISRSTALRDLAELEDLGVPLYIENGRYGGYKVLPSSLLPPIYFTEKEIFSVFFSLQLLDLLSGSPFGSAHSTVKRKLLNTFSEEKQEKIAAATDSVHYAGIDQIETAKNLEELFSTILKNEPINIRYTRYTQKVKQILPIRLTLMDGYWYCIAIDVAKKEMRTYRCDYIEDIEAEVDHPQSLSKEEINQILTTQQKDYRDTPFRVRLSVKGKEHFLKNKFPNMRLTAVEHDFFIVGEFNANELAFLTNYFLGFGEHAEILEPEILREEYTKLIEKVLSRYKE